MFSVDSSTVVNPESLSNPASSLLKLVSRSSVKDDSSAGFSSIDIVISRLERLGYQDSSDCSLLFIHCTLLNVV